MQYNDNAALNPAFSLSVKSGDEQQAKIVIEPLEQGYGHTLGNALRRVMLTSLAGHALTMVRIAGVDHTYTTLEGLNEDIQELVLNLRQIRVKAANPTSGKLTLNVTGPAEVTAADVKTEAGLEIVNSDLHLATVAKGKKLAVEMTVEPGVGYVLSSERKTDVIGDIPVDSLFSPVVKVSYEVESTRVGRRTDYDRLIITVVTDGTVAPAEAVREAAQILARQFQQVVDPSAPAAPVSIAGTATGQSELMKLTVEELDLPTRIANALRKGGFKTVGDLAGVPKNVIAKVKNLGEKSVDVINEAIEKKGVTLGE